MFQFLHNCWHFQPSCSWKCSPSFKFNTLKFFSLLAPLSLPSHCLCPFPGTFYLLQCPLQCQVDDSQTCSSSPDTSCKVWTQDSLSLIVSQQTYETLKLNMHKTDHIILPLKPVSHLNWLPPVENQTILSIIWA